jgi:putative effector of murein hydrolase
MVHVLLAAWQPLGLTPLPWLAVTIVACALGQIVQRVCKGAPMANPVLIAILVVSVLLEATGTPYERYFAGAQFLQFLLGPATVALAVPLALNLNHVRRSFPGSGWLCWPAR